MKRKVPNSSQSEDCSAKTSEGMSEPIKSILKKTASDNSLLQSRGRGMGGHRIAALSMDMPKPRRRGITFNDSVTTYYGANKPEGTEKLDSGDDDDEWKTQYDATGEPECDSPLPDDKNDGSEPLRFTASRITETVRSKMGSIWKRTGSGRTQVQAVSSTPKFEVGQTSINVKKRRQKEYLTASCSSVEGLRSEATPSSNGAVGLGLEGARLSHSLPRGISFDSVELPSASQSWKSRLRQFRRKSGSSSSGTEESSGDAVLTKITKLGG